MPRFSEKALAGDKTYASSFNSNVSPVGLPLTPSHLPGEVYTADKPYVPSIRPTVTPGGLLPSLTPGGLLPTPSHLPGEVHTADRPYVPSIRIDDHDDILDEDQDMGHGVSPPAGGKKDTSSSYFA